MHNDLKYNKENLRSIKIDGGLFEFMMQYFQDVSNSNKTDVPQSYFLEIAEAINTASTCPAFLTYSDDLANQIMMEYGISGIVIYPHMYWMIEDIMKQSIRQSNKRHDFIMVDF